MPWKGLHFNRGLDISSTALRYLAPKVHIISHKNKHCNPWHKKYMLVHLSPKWHRTGMPRAATEGWKFQKLPQKQVKKKKPKLLMGGLKVQELFGQYRSSNSYFYYKRERLRCFKVVVWMQYFFFLLRVFFKMKQISFMKLLVFCVVFFYKLLLTRKLKTLSTERQDKNNTTWVWMEIMQIRHLISWGIWKAKWICSAVPWRRQLSRKTKFTGVIEH